MFVSTRKGQAGLPETTSFAAAFPLSADPEKLTIVTVTQFDNWAVGEGFIDEMVERDTRNMDRNVLRGKINNTAASPAWQSLGNDPFHVAVHDHGRSYAVQPTDRAFTVKANRLPRQMESILRTKKMALEMLHGSIDITSLPIGLQLRVPMLKREIERYAETLALASSQIDREFRSIQHDIDQYVKEQKLIPQNGGIQSILDVNGDEDGDDS